MSLYTVHKNNRLLIMWLGLSTCDAIVAGGAALRWYQDISVGSADIDIFFKNQHGFNKLRQRIEGVPKKDPFELEDLIPKKTIGIVDRLKNLVLNTDSITTPTDSPSIYKYRILCDSDQATTYEITDSQENVTKVQLIKARFFDNPDELINSFDISVSQIATDGLKWYVGKHFLEDFNSRRLRLLHVNKNSIKRIMKYWVYGYEPTDDTLQRIINDPTVVWVYDTASNEDYHDL